MKKYIQPAIYVFEIKMESALLGGSELPGMSTSEDVVETDEYTQHTFWNNNEWSYEE